MRRKNEPANGRGQYVEHGRRGGGMAGEVIKRGKKRRSSGGTQDAFKVG